MVQEAEQGKVASVLIFDQYLLEYSKIWLSIITDINIVQLSSHVQLFATPRTAARQVSLSFTISRSLLKFMPIESVMLFNHLILCHPLFLLSSIFPSIRVQRRREWQTTPVFLLREPQEHEQYEKAKTWLDGYFVLRSIHIFSPSNKDPTSYICPHWTDEEPEARSEYVVSLKTQRAGIET